MRFSKTLRLRWCAKRQGLKKLLSGKKVEYAEGADQGYERWPSNGGCKEDENRRVDSEMSRNCTQGKNALICRAQIKGEKSRLIPC